MAEELLNKHDPKLAYVVKYDHDTPNPRELASPLEMKRVARPLRHIHYVPVKSLIFYSKNHPPQFSYETKIKTPISKDVISVQVEYVGLNPVDLKIFNSYTRHMNYEVGIGREYYGKISEVGSNLADTWSVGDEVCGTFWHPNFGKGTCESTILVDPKVDVVLPKPVNISAQQAASTFYCLGAAFNILDKLDQEGKLSQSSNILINGASTMTGIFALQLLKFHYRILNKIVLISSTSGMNFIKSNLPELVDELLFIDYAATNGKIYKPLSDLVASNELVEYNNETGNFITQPFGQGSFNLVLDFIGGYDIIGHSSSILSKDATYITTVGDNKSNYKKDTFNSWGTASSNIRKLFGQVLWSFDYQMFYFDPNAKLATNEWPKKCHELIENEVVKFIPVDRVYDWKEHQKAFSYLQTGRAHGKVVLKVEKF
ncbi:Ast2/Ast1 [Kluyveromyces lactis]|nr:Ast2/Ast1 [Kluyveromyces lactis]